MHARRTARQPAVFPSDMADALRHHQRGDFEEARWRYLDILEDGLADPRLAYLLACLDIHAGDLGAAVNRFRRGIRNDLGTESTPSSAEVSVPTGFSAALAVDPRPGAICRQLAANLPIKGEKLLPALVALQAWLRHVPQDIHALERFADVAEHIGDHALSAALLQQAQDLDPANALLPFKRGNALNGQGEHRQALAAYAEAIHIDPGMCEAHVNTAATLQQIGRTEVAEQRLRETLADHPHHPDALFTLAEVLFQDGRPEEAVKHYAQTVAVAPGHTDAWLHQAHAWKRMGLTRNAAEAYRRAADLAPERPEIHFDLGATLHGLKDFQGAEAALDRAASLDPDHAAARYLLNAVRQESVSRAPRAYVEALFDRYAESFDRHMKGLLHYRIPAYLRKYLKPRARRKGGFRRLLDVGCGTGLAGDALRDMAAHMTGVDIARHILAKAAEKNIYDELVHADFRHFLAGTAARYDLVVAADVFIYTGDLATAFALIREKLSPHGCLAFSIEEDAKGSFRLRRSGRFAHSREYITRLANTKGFTIETERPVPVRMENNRWVGGVLFVMAAA